MRTRLVVAAATAALVVSLSGCSSAVDAVKDKATCTLVGTAQEKVKAAADADPATLDSLKSALGQVSAGLGALGDKVPATVKDQLTAAEGQLDQIITEAKSDPAAAKQKIAALTTKIDDALASLKSSAGC